MSSTLPRVDGPGDAELISAVRGGDVAAYGELFERHVDAARRLARQLVSPVRRRRPGLRRLRQGAAPCSSAAAVPTSRSAPTCSPPYAACTSTRSAPAPGCTPPTTSRRSTRACRSATPRSRASRTRAAHGVRLAARALAAGAVAHRGRGPEARRRRAAARHERQLRLRARLPRPRGPAPGVPDHARRRPRRGRLPLDPRAPRRLRPRRRLASRRRHGRGAPRRVPQVHGDLPRAHRGQLEPLRHPRPRSCSAAPPRPTSPPGDVAARRAGSLRARSGPRLRRRATRPGPRSPVWPRPPSSPARQPSC